MDELEKIKRECEKTATVEGEFEKVQWQIVLGTRKAYGQPVLEIGPGFCIFHDNNAVSLFWTKEALIDYNKKVAVNRVYLAEWEPKLQKEYDTTIAELKAKGRPGFELDSIKNRALHISGYLPYNPRFLSGLCGWVFDLQRIHHEITLAKNEFDKGLVGHIKYVPLWCENNSEARGPQPLLKIMFGSE